MEKDSIPDTTEVPSTSTSSSSISSGSFSSSSSGLSAAELRERRRQKILANQSSRLDMITGGGGGLKGQAEKLAEKQQQINGAGDPPDEILNWKKLSREIGEEKAVDDDDVTVLRRRVTQTSDATDSSMSTPSLSTNNSTITTTTTTIVSSSTTTTSIKSIINPGKVGGSSSSSSHHKTVTFAPGTATAPAFPSSPSSSFKPGGFMVQQPDGSTIHPKLSARACRFLVFLLGIFLAVFNAKYFLVTFFSWEVAVFIINGFPSDEPPSNNIIILIALLGLKEPHLQRVKFMIKLATCLMTDFSILMVSSLTSRVLFESFIMK